MDLYKGKISRYTYSKLFKTIERSIQSCEMTVGKCLALGLARFGVPIVKLPLPVLESVEQVLHPAVPRV